MTTTHTLSSATESVRTLRRFIGPMQLSVLGDCCRSEEREYFIAKLAEYAALVETMPKTYEQDGKGELAEVWLHYFTGGCDWWITEKDSEAEQEQAFGLVDFGGGPELGYISIREITEAGAELDLHWNRKTLAEIRKGR